jgi:hypothetical protein
MLFEYEEIVARMAAEKQPSRISNLGPSHASAVIKNIFLNADSSVKLFSGSMKYEFYANPEIINAVRVFLSKKDAHLQILVQDDADVGKVLNLLDPLLVEKVDVRKRLDASSYLNHYLVADRRAYRLELDDRTCKAIVNFNEPEVASVLADEFDSGFLASSAKNEIQGVFTLHK